MTKREATNGEPYAGNLHVRSDEGEIASATPGAWVSTLHRKVHCGKPYAGNFVAWFGLLFLVAGALQVHAGKYYLKKSNGDNDPTWIAYDGSEDTTGVSVEHDYVVRGFATNLTIKGIDYTVNSLTIGENDIGGRMYLNKKKTANTSASVIFQNDGLFLVKGSMRSQGVPCNIRGNITVSANRDFPFGVFPSGSNSEVRFNPPNSDNTSGGILYGSNESAIVIGLEYALNDKAYQASDNQGYLASFYNLGEYKGLISVTSKHENASCVRGFGAAVQLCDPNVQFEGDLKICGGGALLFTNEIAVVTVGGLTLEPGSMIRSAVDLTAKTCNRVEASKLNVQGPVCVMADYQHKKSTDGKEVRCALLTAPANGLNLDDFYFMPDPNVTDDSNTDCYQQRAHLEVGTENEVDTLYLVVEPIITLEKTDGSTPTAFDDDPILENPDAWQDKSKPVGGRHYHLNSKYLKFMGDTDYTFPGKTFIHDGGRTMFSGERDIVFSNYVWRSGIIYSMKNADVVLKGKMLVSAVAEATSPRSLRSFGYPLNINADISGAGDILINNTGDTPYQGKITLSGDNSGYSGKIAVSNTQNTVSYPKRWTYLYVSKADSLGGTLGTFTFDALSLSKLARLIPIGTMTLSKTSNRGLFIIGEGVIAPGDGVTLRMEWPITMNGTLYKDGLGVLEMAGSIRFYDAETSSSVETPRAEADVLELREGTLKVGSAKACDGLRIDVQSGTSILLPKPGTDSNLDKYGLYNVKAGATPFTLAEGVSKLPIAFEEQVPADSLEGMVTNALFTVANSAVESVRSILPYGVKPYRGVRASIVEIPLADEEATTFACVTKRYGLIFSVR